MALIASAAIPLTVAGLGVGIDLLGAAPARAANECGVPSNGTVICVPGVYPSGISYVVVSDLTVTLQQTPSLAVNVQNGGINLASPFLANVSANLALGRSFVGTATSQSVAPSINNTSGAAISVSNGNGAVAIDLSNPGADSGIALVGSTNGIYVTSQGDAAVTLTNGSIAAANGSDINVVSSGAATVTLTNLTLTNASPFAIPASSISVTSNGAATVSVTSGSITAQNGSDISVTSNGAVNVSTGAAQLTASNGPGILIDQTGASGAISVVTGGTINAVTYQAGDGIQIRASNALNTSNISLDVSSVINAQGAGLSVNSTVSRNVAVTIESGANINAQEDGIFASTGGTGSITVTTNTGSTIFGDTNNGGIGDAINLSTTSGAVNLTTATGSTVYIGSNIASPLLGHPQKDIISLASTSGDITATNGADLLNTTTPGASGFFANGIYATTGGNISITSSGSIGTAASQMGGNGVNATITSGLGNLSIVNSGQIFSVNQGVLASNQGTGNLSINTTGAISSSDNTAISTAAQSGATAITVAADLDAVNGSGVASTSTTGTINVSVISGASITANTGLSGASSGGAVTLSNAGAINASDIGLSGTISSGGGDLTVSNTGVVSAAGLTAVTAFNAGSGAILVNLSGSVSALSGNGVQTSAAGGATNITLGGTLTSPAGFGVYSASTSGAIAMTLSQGGAITASDALVANTQGGAITLTNAGQINASDSGLAAQITGGSGVLSVLNTGAISAAGTAGVSANSSGAGAVGVSSTGTISATNGVGVEATSTSGATTVTLGGMVTAAGDGVVASSDAGSIAVTVQSGAQISGTTAVQAVSLSGNVTINNAGVVNASADGFFVKSAGSGSVTVSSSGPIVSTGTGIAAEAAGAGAVSVSTTAPGASVSATQAPAIETVAGSGATTLSLAGNVSSLEDDAVAANSDSGAISITTAAGQQITGVNGLVAASTSGAVSIANASAINGQFEAIRASVTGGSQGITVTNSAPLVSNGAAVVYLQDGGSGTTAFSTSGALTAANGVGVLVIGHSGAINLGINANVSADLANSILVSAPSSPVNLTIGAGAVLQSSFGVLLDSPQGALSVTNAGTLSSFANTQAPAPGLALTTQSSVSLSNASTGTITAGGATVSGAAVSLLNATSITATNSGTITTASTSHGGIAFYDYTTIGGASNTPTVSLTNTSGGVIDGVVYNNTSGAMTFNNAGTWTVAARTSILGLVQTGILNNSGILQVGFSGAGVSGQVVTAITGVAVVNNSGVISLVNGVGNEILTISGAYVGSGPATLKLDFTAGSASTDLLRLGGAASGSTSVQLSTLGSPQLFTRTPIVDAATSSSPTAFTLPSSAHQGFAAFHIAFDDTTGVYSVVATPDIAAYETMKFAEAGQNLYFSSATAWSTQLEQERALEDRDGGIQEGFHAWGQAFGSSHDYTDTRSFTEENIAGSFDLNYSQSVIGAEVGLGVTKIIGGGSATIGALSGYAHSSVVFSATDDGAQMDEFNGGVYLALSKDHWFMDGLVKFDVGTFHVSSAYAGYAQSLNLSQAGGSFEFGRRLLSRNWYVEPSIGLTFVAGAFGRQGSSLYLSNFTTNGVTVNLGDDSTLRLKAGVVAGMAPVHALGGAFSPYAGVALVDDLFGANRVNLVSGGTAMSFSNRALGVAGELRVGAQLLLGKGLTLSAEGEGAGGARVVGGGGRLMARLAW